MIDGIRALLLNTNFAVFAAIFVMAVQVTYFIFRSRKDIAVSYRISVIGLPRSGKTALISAIFDHIFHSTSGSAFSPVGEKTIGKINDQITLLDSRKIFKPTKEDDVFIFRFLYYIRNLLVLARVRYEGEVVDFPGEMSAALIDSAEDGSIREDIGLFNKEFYSWILSSKVHVFVIDLAKLFLIADRRSFAAAQAAEIRKTWQVLNEEISRAQRSADRRIALVFSKADLIYFLDTDEEILTLNEPFNEIIRKFGFDHAPPINHIGVDDLDRRHFVETYVKKEFKSLIDYFTGQSCEFGLFFTSSYKDEAGIRIGIEELVRFVLPKASFAD